MEQIEQFFTDYEKTAMAVYTGAAFLGVLIAIAYKMHTLFKRHLDRKIDEAKIEQRHVFQAGYFDVWEDRQKEFSSNQLRHEREIATMKKDIQIVMALLKKANR